MSRAVLRLALGFIPQIIVMTAVYGLGFYRGHEAGRIEMKCAIFAVVEGLGPETRAPGTITLGCDKRPTPTLTGRDTGGKCA